MRSHLSPGERKILSSLLRFGPLTWSDLLEKTHLSKAGLSKLLKRLEEEKLVERVIVKKDIKAKAGYKATIKSLSEAEDSRFMMWLFEEISKIGKEKNIDPEYLLMKIDNHLYTALMYYLIEALESKKRAIDSFQTFARSFISKIIKVLEENPIVRDALERYLRDLLG